RPLPGGGALDPHRDDRAPVTLDVPPLDMTPGRTGAAAHRPGDDVADGEAAGSETARTRPLRQLVEDFERRAILAAVDGHRGNWAAAARALGMHRSNLHQLATRLGLISPRRESGRATR
ncbi:MAG: helix-turn-helix domain-containing protein, partial [Bacteroidales bacterium]